MRPDLHNIVRIKAVHHALGYLADEVVYVGGATVSLYRDRPAGEARVTDDVDIVVELINYAGYAAIEEKLRQPGFQNDRESGIICRYKIHGIVVDIMPTNENVLGFRNKWYPAGFTNSQEAELDPGTRVRIFRPEYFLASKLDAFSDRGGGDGRTSSDFEDIIYLLNNRNTIWEEIRLAGAEVKKYILEEFNKLINYAYIDEWISAHLEYAEQARVRTILGRMRELVESEVV